MTTQEDTLERLRKIRRRFVGAIVLLLAALITLPLVMEKKPKGQKAPVEVRIPARDQVPATVPPPAAVPRTARRAYPLLRDAGRHARTGGRATPVARR